MPKGSVLGLFVFKICIRDLGQNIIGILVRFVDDMKLEGRVVGCFFFFLKERESRWKVMLTGWNTGIKLTRGNSTEINIKSYI